jgi:sugar phosphate isomerase/epimerase
MCFGAWKENEELVMPRIYLAIDNCFASKRWTDPIEWAQIVKQLGLGYVEASADNECDALYADAKYLEDWVGAVRTACDQTGVRVANLYSGHGTYATLGLAHPDRRNQDRMLNLWVKVMIANASRLGAGLGFFCHAFNERVLQDCQTYRAAEETLYERLAEVSAYARECGIKTVGVEQMYSPNQIPWTLEGAQRLLREVYRRSGQPFYLTIDTGHQVGQRMFLRPSFRQLDGALQTLRAGGKLPRGLWLGPAAAYTLFCHAAAAAESQQEVHLRRVEEEMDRYPYLFASFEDGDLYLWLRRFACYSPIIHLQQTSGGSSSHSPFTEENNRQGIVRAEQVLRAIADSYNRQPEPGMPPRCEHIYLTLEIFSKTADLPTDIMRGLKDSVEYWRTYVPKDGLSL